jgi:hypothetical protein
MRFRCGSLRLAWLAVPILGLVGCATTPSAGTPSPAVTSSTVQPTAPAKPTPAAVAAVLGQRLDAMLAAQTTQGGRLADAGLPSGAAR